VAAHRRLHRPGPQPGGGRAPAPPVPPGGGRRCRLCRRRPGLHGPAGPLRLSARQLPHPCGRASADHGRPGPAGPRLAGPHPAAVRAPGVGPEKRPPPQAGGPQPGQARPVDRRQPGQGGLLDHHRPHHHRLPLAVHAARGPGPAAWRARDHEPEAARDRPRHLGHRVPLGHGLCARHLRHGPPVRTGGLHHHGGPRGAVRPPDRSVGGAGGDDPPGGRLDRRGPGRGPGPVALTDRRGGDGHRVRRVPGDREPLHLPGGDEPHGAHESAVGAALGAHRGQPGRGVRVDPGCPDRGPGGDPRGRRHPGRLPRGDGVAGATGVPSFPIGDAGPDGA
jgi:hypothetical protein